MSFFVDCFEAFIETLDAMITTRFIVGVFVVTSAIVIAALVLS